MPSQSLDPRIASLDRLAILLDNRWRIPGTNIGFGVEPLIGLVPILGNGVTTIISCGIIASAWRMGARKRTIARMVRNVGLDTLVSAVPIVGNLADVVIKANMRNIALLRQDLLLQSAARDRETLSDHANRHVTIDQKAMLRT